MAMRALKVSAAPPTVVECGSAVTTCKKISIVRYHTHSPTTYKANFSSTAYTGDCGACIGIFFPSYYTCTQLHHRPVQLRLRAVRAAALL
uniref:Secreted protein n=1 Tax=Macrostomum lignano TaxID=282301 RepID=A0A1I8HI09_9PLAT